MGVRHNDLIPHIEAGRTGAKKGNWTKKRLRRHRLALAAAKGKTKAPGYKRVEREAQRQSSVQQFMRYMDSIERGAAKKKGATRAKG